MVEHGEKAELWRLHVGMTTGGASWGDTHYYTTESKMRDGLLAILAQINSKPSNRERSGLNWRAWQYWRIFSWGEDREQVESPKKWPTRVHGLHQLVDGRWVELQYELTPPTLAVSRKDLL